MNIKQGKAVFFFGSFSSDNNKPNQNCCQTGRAKLNVETKTDQTEKQKQKMN